MCTRIKDGYLMKDGSVIKLGETNLNEISPVHIAEMDASPFNYVQNDEDNFDNRVLSDSVVSYTNFNTAMSDGDTLRINITSLGKQLFSNYDYSDGKINILWLDNNSATDQYLLLSSYESGEKPKLILYGKR